MDSPQISPIVVPDYLIYEIMDGKPIYYRGYKDVLRKLKTFEEIMASSSLQSEIIDYLLGIFYGKVNRKKYRIYTNEIGAHISKRNNLSCDISIFDKTVLTSDMVEVKYPTVPSKLVVEVDTKGDVAELGFEQYVHRKTQKLLDFGTEKVIWIFTTSRKVMIAEAGKDWITTDWNRNHELWEGNTFNVAEYLEAEGIRLPPDEPIEA